MNIVHFETRHFRTAGGAESMIWESGDKRHFKSNFKHLACGECVRVNLLHQCLKVYSNAFPHTHIDIHIAPHTHADTQNYTNKQTTHIIHTRNIILPTKYIFKSTKNEAPKNSHSCCARMQIKHSQNEGFKYINNKNQPNTKENHTNLTRNSNNYYTLTKSAHRPETL